MGPVVANGIAQRAERDELHDDGRLVVLLDDVVYADHVRVPQPRGQPRLSHRALAGDLPFVRGHLRRPDDFLYRHVPVEQFVARPPDRTHPAAADDGTKTVPPGQESLRLARSHHRPLPSQDGT
jgi:hypothetical protein